MANWNSWRAGVVAAALVVWPVLATAQSDQQSGSSAQGSSTTAGQQNPNQQNQSGTQDQSNPQNQSGSQAQSSGQGYGQGQGQGENTRQEALAQLTAARQSLADLTKLPAASHLEGQSRSEINQLITDFNALITSTGPEWRQAYDKVQSDLRSTLGPNASQSGENAVGTSGTARSSLDPSLAAKLSEVRQHVDQFGQIVGVPAGQSAVAAESQNANQNANPSNPNQNSASQSGSSNAGQSNTMGSQSGFPTGTSGSSASASASVNNQQALRNIDQINAILSRVLAQPSMSPNQDSVTVSKQDLQQIQQYLNQLRQSVGGGGQ